MSMCYTSKDKLSTLIIERMNISYRWANGLPAVIVADNPWAERARMCQSTTFQIWLLNLSLVQASLRASSKTKQRFCSSMETAVQTLSFKDATGTSVLETSFLTLLSQATVLPASLGAAVYNSSTPRGCPARALWTAINSSFLEAAFQASSFSRGIRIWQVKASVHIHEIPGRSLVRGIKTSVHDSSSVWHLYSILLIVPRWVRNIETSIHSTGHRSISSFVHVIDPVSERMGLLLWHFETASAFT